MLCLVVRPCPCPSLHAPARRSAPVEFAGCERMEKVQPGDVFRVTRIELSASTDASDVPDFRIVGVLVSEPTNPGLVLTKDHLSNYEGELRGGDRLHHSRYGGAEKVYATQLPLGGFDDAAMNQLQGDSAHHGLLDCNGLFAFGQFSTSLSRFKDQQGIYMVGLGRFAHFENDALVFDWDEIQKAIKVSPRAIMHWDGIRLLDRGRYHHELQMAQHDVQEMRARADAAEAAFSTHRGRTNEFEP